MAWNLTDSFNCVYDEKQNILESDKIVSKFSTGASIGEVLFDSLKKRPDNKLQVDDTFNITTTNAQIFSWAISIAQYLKELGFNHTDIVGISAKNSTYVLPVVLGCFFNCTPFHSINPDLDEEFFSHCFGLTKPKLIFCDGEIYEKIRCTTQNYCTMIVTITQHIQGIPKVIDLLKPTLVVESYQPVELVEGPSQTIAILCSSGTTGKPKAVCLSKTILLSENVLLNCDTIAYIASGIDWFTGLWILVNSCLFNCTRILSKRSFDVNHFLELVRKYKISYAFLSSRYVAMLVSHPLAPRENLSTLKAIQFGGSSLLEGTFKRLTTMLHENVIISFVYGSTELGCIAFNFDKTRPKSVGKLYPNLKLRIVNDKGENLRLNEVGELLIEPHAPWKCYYGNTEETARAVDIQGWHHTGDVGYLDDQYFLYLVDRKKEILKYQGLHYWPAEIEEVIAEILDVEEVCVVSVSDERFGDIAGALVVKALKSPLTAEQVVEHVKKHFSLPHKQINAGVYFVDQLPYNANNKVIKHKSKLLLGSLISNKQMVK